MDLLTLKTLGPGAFRGSPYKWTPSGPVLREPQTVVLKDHNLRDRTFTIKKETKKTIAVTRVNTDEDKAEYPLLTVKLTREGDWWKTNQPQHWSVVSVKGEKPPTRQYEPASSSEEEAPKEKPKAEASMDHSIRKVLTSFLRKVKSGEDGKITTGYSTGVGYTVGGSKEFHIRSDTKYRVRDDAPLGSHGYAEFEVASKTRPGYASERLTFSPDRSGFPHVMLEVFEGDLKGDKETIMKHILKIVKHGKLSAENLTVAPRPPRHDSDSE
jgi:hypothetical protein